MSDLEINRRSIDVPNSAKKARKNGKVPGVLYGKAIKNLLFEVGELELAHEVARNGQHGVVSSVPIHYIGEEFLNKKGIVLQKEKDSVKVECTVDSIPKYIDFNIGTGTVGSVYKFGDLEVASEISVLDDLNSVIASISYERNTVSRDMEEAEDADVKDVAE